MTQTTAAYAKNAKGTAGYEEWLAKFQASANRNAKGTLGYDVWVSKFFATTGLAKGKTEDLFEEAQPSKKNEFSRSTLVGKPAQAVTEMKVWAAAVNKVTDEGRKCSNYGAAMAVYKSKSAK